MNARSNQGGIVARVILSWIFRLTCFALFAPVAFRYAMKGQLFEAGLALLIAVYVGALLSPNE